MSSVLHILPVILGIGICFWRSHINTFEGYIKKCWNWILLYMLWVTLNFPKWLWETLVHKPFSQRTFVINNINFWWNELSDWHTDTTMTVCSPEFFFGSIKKKIKKYESIVITFFSYCYKSGCINSKIARKKMHKCIVPPLNKSTANGTYMVIFLHHDLYNVTLDSTCTGHHIIVTYFLWVIWIKDPSKHCNRRYVFSKRGSLFKNCERS
jgi:hypothetical protein